MSSKSVQEIMDEALKTARGRKRATRDINFTVTTDILMKSEIIKIAKDVKRVAIYDFRQQLHQEIVNALAEHRNEAFREVMKEMKASGEMKKMIRARVRSTLIDGALDIHLDNESKN